jgi:hypothetical protein
MGMMKNRPALCICNIGEDGDVAADPIARSISIKRVLQSHAYSGDVEHTKWEAKVRMCSYYQWDLHH